MIKTHFTSRIVLFLFVQMPLTLKGNKKNIFRNNFFENATDISHFLYFKECNKLTQKSTTKK
jgi:hypothetical protein